MKIHKFLPICESANLTLYEITKSFHIRLNILNIFLHQINIAPCIIDFSIELARFFIDYLVYYIHDIS